MKKLRLHNPIKRKSKLRSIFKNKKSKNLSKQKFHMIFKQEISSSAERILVFKNISKKTDAIKSKNTSSKTNNDPKQKPTINYKTIKSSSRKKMNPKKNHCK